MDELAIVEQIEKSLDLGISQGIFPGGAVWLLRQNKPAITVCRGKAGSGEQEPLVTEQTLYDLASLTKVVVTLPLILLSVQHGKLSLTDSVVTHLPQLGEGHGGAEKEKIKIIHLLTHSSGLPAWRPFFLKGSGKRDYLRMIAEEQMIYKPGEQVVYSDLGFMLLGFILEEIWQTELSALAKQWVFEPSGMTHTGYLPQSQPVLRDCLIAPAEEGTPFERNMAEQYIWQLEAAEDPRAAGWRAACEGFAWRQDVIRGQVHDCNAYHGLEGVSGHAGLFSTLTDVARYMRIWTSEDAPVRIDPLLLSFAARAQTGSAVPRRAVGWEASATGGSLDQIAHGCTGGDLLSEKAFGHTGFTGTSIWSDPLRGATLITLTNRVHPIVHTAMNAWRRAHHNQIFSSIKPVGTS